MNRSMSKSEGRNSCGPVFFLIKLALRLATVDLRLMLEAREMLCASYCDILMVYVDVNEAESVVLRKEKENR